MDQQIPSRALRHNMQNVFPTDQHGFTLVEFMVYTALAGLVFGLMLGVYLNVFNVYAKSYVAAEVNQNARFAMDVMAGRIRNAESINSPSAGSTSSSLSLEMATSALDPTVFDLSSGVLRIKEGASATVDLTSSEVTVSALTFSNLSYTDTPGTIRIEMTVEFVNTGGTHQYDFARTYYETVNIREK
jgi:type II secretory pathway pseudopilin PulG